MENTRNAYQLAALADCGSPKNSESPGAKMLLGIAEEIYDRADDLSESSWPEDLIYEIVDGWPSVYTSEMWEQFLDLSAWQESPDSGEGDMVQMAFACLYQIGERMGQALWFEIRDSMMTDDKEFCEDCDAELTEDQNVICSECGEARKADELANLEANMRDDEAQVEGDFVPSE